MTLADITILDSFTEGDHSEDPQGVKASGNGSVIISDNTSPNEQYSRKTRSGRRMADLNPGCKIQSINSRHPQKKSKTKHSRSPSPFSAVTPASPEAPLPPASPSAPLPPVPPIQVPPSKKRMPTPPTKPWIKNDDLFKKVQDKLSLYGLGPYDVPVPSNKWLPFNLQSKILTCAQSIVEEALFEFLYKTWPEICEENGWEEMGEAELNELAPAMMAGMQAHYNDIEKFIDAENPKISESLSYLLQKIGQIRHCAVHRTKKIPAIIVELMVRDASYITMYLNDNERAKILDSLRLLLEPLSFNLQARFGDKLQGKVERKLKRTSEEIERIREALRVEEERERQTQMQLEDIKAQDEAIYEGRLEALRKALV